MSSTQHPSRPADLRIGDADRDRAVQALSEHLASGRLDQSEFDERMAAALNARTAKDLEPLFLDLPEPRPVTNTYSPAVHARPTHLPYASPPQPLNVPQLPEPRQSGAGARTPCGRGRRVPYAIGPAIWFAAIALVVISGGHLWWMMIVASLVCSGLWSGSHRRKIHSGAGPDHLRIRR